MLLVRCNCAHYYFTRANKSKNWECMLSLCSVTACLSHCRTLRVIRLTFKSNFCRLGRMPPQAAQPPAPQSHWPKPMSQASVPFGSPALLLQPRQSAATSPAQQTLVLHSALAGLSTQAAEQQRHTGPGDATGGITALQSLLSADQPSCLPTH